MDDPELPGGGLYETAIVAFVVLLAMIAAMLGAVYLGSKL